MHDYDPSWDYPVVSPENMDFVEDSTWAKVHALIQVAHQELCPVLGFEQGFDVFYVEPGGFSTGIQDAFALYCNGTSSRPIIGLDLFMLELECARLSIDYLTEVKLTIAHELGHAYQDKMGIEHDEDCEDQVEVFGFKWTHTGIIDPSLLTRPN